MATTIINRRKFLEGSAGVFLLAGFCGSRVSGAKLVYDLQTQLKMAPGGKVPDEVRILGGYLQAFSLPAGEMPPTGGWTAVYDILKCDPTPRYKIASGIPMYNTVMGQVAITKRGASPDYEIQMSYKPTRSVESVEAQISCSDSPVAALNNWDMKWSFRGEELSYTNCEQGTVAADHFSVTSRGHANRFELKRPLTCLWTLFDAVRWLPAKTGWSREFDMYMDLSSLRRNQSLAFSGCGQVAVASGVQEMNFYEQLGEGIEPIHYAVDKRQRTLFVTQGQLGWGLNRIERG